MSSEGPASPSDRPSPTLVIGVVVVVFLAVAALVAMFKPSGDKGQSRYEGPQAVMPSASLRPQTGAPIVGSSVAVAFEPGSGSGGTLTCTVTLDNVANDHTTVVHLVLTGKGVGPVPLLHPGERSVDGSVASVGGQPGTFVATQQITPASGKYACEVAAVMTASGPAKLGGQTKGSTSV